MTIAEGLAKLMTQIAYRETSEETTCLTDILPSVCEEIDTEAIPKNPEKNSQN